MRSKITLPVSECQGTKSDDSGHQINEDLVMVDHI